MQSFSTMFFYVTPFILKSINFFKKRKQTHTNQLKNNNKSHTYRRTHRLSRAYYLFDSGEYI